MSSYKLPQHQFIPIYYKQPHTLQTIRLIWSSCRTIVSDAWNRTKLWNGTCLHCDRHCLLHVHIFKVPVFQCLPETFKIEETSRVASVAFIFFYLQRLSLFKPNKSHHFTVRVIKRTLDLGLEKILKLKPKT